MLNVTGDIIFKKTDVGFLKFSSDGGHEYFKNSRPEPSLTVQMINVKLPGEGWIDSDLYSVEETLPRKWPRPEIPELK